MVTSLRLSKLLPLTTTAFTPPTLQCSWLGHVHPGEDFLHLENKKTELKTTEDIKY